MPHRLVRLAGALLLALGAGPAVAAEGELILSHQPPELVERLERQRVLVLEELKQPGARSEDFFLAWVIFEAPPDQAYRLMSATERHIEFRPEMRSMEAVERGDRHVDQHSVAVMYVSLVYHLVYRLDPARRSLRWQLDDRFENGLARAEGFWEFYELEGDRTLGRFGALVDVGSALPRFFQKWVTSRNLPRTLERARRWVEADGEYRP